MMNPIDNLSPYQPAQDIFNGSIGAGGSSNMITLSSPITATTAPIQNFDLSVLSGLKSSAKYQGNRVSDIQEAYQTYISGNPIGRGGKYAIDAANKYGVSIVEAARGYLAGILPILPQATTQTTTQETVKQNNTVVTEKNPFQILADILPTLFGNAVYNPPLQSQSYGYSPTASEQPITQSSGGLNIGLLVIVGVVGIVGYFLYKRFVQ